MQSNKAPSRVYAEAVPYLSRLVYALDSQGGFEGKHGDFELLQVDKRENH